MEMDRARDKEIRLAIATTVMILGILASAPSSLPTTKGLSQIVTPDLQGEGDLSLSLQIQDNRISKLINDRYHLLSYPRLPIQSRALREQWPQARSLRLHRLYLYVSCLGQNRKQRGLDKVNFAAPAPGILRGKPRRIA